MAHPKTAPCHSCHSCGKAIAHGKIFFRLTGARDVCVICIDKHDLYDELEVEEGVS